MYRHVRRILSPTYDWRTRTRLRVFGDSTEVQIYRRRRVTSTVAFIRSSTRGSLMRLKQLARRKFYCPSFQTIIISSTNPCVLNLSNVLAQPSIPHPSSHDVHSRPIQHQEPHDKAHSYLSPTLLLQCPLSSLTIFQQSKKPPSSPPMPRPTTTPSL